jgi:hypothetical protein
VEKFPRKVFEPWNFFLLSSSVLHSFIFILRKTWKFGEKTVLVQSVMSSRALRRLQEGSGVQGLPCTEPLDGDEEPVSGPFAGGARAKISAPHLNPFDLVGYRNISKCLRNVANSLCRNFRLFYSVAATKRRWRQTVRACQTFGPLKFLWNRLVDLWSRNFFHAFGKVMWTVIFWTLKYYNIWAMLYVHYYTCNFVFFM